MRHILTQLIAFHWTAVFALLAIVSLLDPERGIFAALSFLGAAPTPDAYSTGGGPLMAGFVSFAFTVAGVLFLWTLATAFFGGGQPHGGYETLSRLAFGAGVGAFSMLMLAGALFPVPDLFATSAVAIAALLISYLAVFAERWTMMTTSGPADADIRAATRLMAAGAAHSAMLGQISGRTRPGKPGADR